VSIVARSVNAAIQIGSVLFLARLLSPEDYGLVGMVTAITGFAPVLVDLGSRDAIVQRARITEEEVSALFWITQAVGIGFAAMIAGGGPLIAHFYGEPRLTMISVVSSLTFITSALTAQHYALLRRAMKFQELGIIEVIANFLGASLAVAMALYGLHYWALVTRPIASAMFLAAGSWIQCRWIPGRPRLTSEVKSMLRFGLNVTGFTMFDFAGKSADRVAIGYRTGAASLGYYQNAAFVYDNLIDIIVGPLHGVAVSALSKLRDNYVELRRSWAKALSTLAFFSAPAFGLLAATSQDLIVLLLGPKWARSGVLLSILALRGIPASIERTCGWLHVTAGRTDRWMRWGMALAGAQFVALCLALPYGPTGIVTATVCRLSGKLAAEGCNHAVVLDDQGEVTARSMVYTEYFARGTEPTAFCNLHPIGGFNGAVATVFTPSEKPDPVRIEPPRPPVAVVTDTTHASSPPPAETEPPKKKRGFWSKIFGGRDRANDEKKARQQ